jgi:hypothetical protein
VTAISSASGDGSFDGIAAATCSGGHVVVVDTRLMRVLLIMAGHPQFVQALDAWPVKGAAVASSSGGGGGGGSSIVTAPDPRIFVTGCDDGCIRKWSELPSPRHAPLSRHLNLVAGQSQLVLSLPHSTLVFQSSRYPCHQTRSLWPVVMRKVT